MLSKWSILNEAVTTVHISSAYLQGKYAGEPVILYEHVIKKVLNILPNTTVAENHRFRLRGFHHQDIYSSVVSGGPTLLRP